MPSVSLLERGVPRPGLASGQKRHLHPKRCPRTAFHPDRLGLSPASEPDDCIRSLQRTLACHFASAVLAFGLCAGSAMAEDVTFSFRASTDPDIRAAQTRLVEVYGYANYYFVDPSFGGLDWPRAFQDALRATYDAKSAEEVHSLTRGLIRKLEDPFTRILETPAAAVYSAESSGKVLSFGLGVDCEVATRGQCQVVFMADGSPASNSGIQVGDAIIEVDGKRVDAAVARSLKDTLQDRASSKLDLLLLHSAAPDAEPTPVAVQLVLSEDVNPVQYSILSSEDSADIGYVRVIVFSENTAAGVYSAVQDLAVRNIQGLVLDLRDNPGGRIGAGIDVARLLLDEGDVIVYAYDRDGHEERVPVVQSMEPPSFQKLPMAVLVNSGTASTSEMLAGALRSNRGAVLVGETTYGKGVTQKVVPLSDGYIFLLSTISYKTADRKEVNKVGLDPGMVCKPDSVGVEQYSGGGVVGGVDLLLDPCIRVAVDALTSKP